MYLILQIAAYFCISDSSKIAPAFYGLERPALEYELPPLLYSFDELEPYLDEASAKMHYFEYHAQYVNNVNALLKRWRRITKGKQVTRMSIIDIMRNLSHVPLLYRNDLKNYGSGLKSVDGTLVNRTYGADVNSSQAYINHNLYWSTISPNVQGEHRLPVGTIQKDITKKFGSFSEFKSTFTDMATNYFGSGFVWLCRNYSSSDNPGDLVVVITANEECPVTQGLLPILGLDIWEHAYILKWHNEKSKYIENWWFLVDWQQVNSLSDWWTGLKLHDEL